MFWVDRGTCKIQWQVVLAFYIDVVAWMSFHKAALNRERVPCPTQVHLSLSALPGGEANSARAYETLLGAEQWELDGARGTARVGGCILRDKAHGGFAVVGFNYRSMSDQEQSYVHCFGSEDRNPGLLFPDTDPANSQPSTTIKIISAVR